MSKIHIELTPDVASVLGVALTNGAMELTNSNKLAPMDCSLLGYYEDKLKHLGEELVLNAPDIELVSGAHPLAFVVD